jgi:hypothetical protein
MTSRKKNQKIIAATRRKIMEVMNEELRAAGQPTLDDLERLQTELGPKAGIHIGILTGFIDVLNRMSEPNPQELENMVTEMRAHLRYAIRPALTKAIEQIKKQSLRMPGGGRHSALTREQQSQACDEMATLIRKKGPYKIALIRIGLRFGVSSRTVQRTWQRREAI